MKALLLFVLAIFLGSACAQSDQNIPAAVKSKLKALYPKAEELKWDQEDADFEASFEVDDVEMSVLFNGQGKVLEVETEMEAEDLPAAVKTSLDKDFAGYDIEEAAKIVKDGQTTYEAEIEKGEIKLDAIYDAQGTLLQKIEKKEKDEDSGKTEDNDKEDKD